MGYPRLHKPGEIEKDSQHFVIFRNKKSTKSTKERAGTGSKMHRK